MVAWRYVGAAERGAIKHSLSRREARLLSAMGRMILLRSFALRSRSGGVSFASQTVELTAIAPTIPKARRHGPEGTPRAQTSAVWTSASGNDVNVWTLPDPK